MHKWRPNAVTILIAAYAVLLCAVLPLTPLWLDEIQQLAPGRESWPALIEWIQTNPGGVPLPYVEQRGFIALLGHSVFVARLPAALCSIAGAVVFALLCARLGIRKRAWATALFLILPLQFRYALEARGYSQGLLCALLSLWLFLRARDRGTAASAALWGASVVVGLYSQPLTILPVMGELLWLIGQHDVPSRTKRVILGATLVGVLAFVPWCVAERHTQARFSSMSHYFFSWRQITPLTFLHELSGGGYLCTVALLFAAGAGMVSRSALRHRQLLLAIALGGLAGPIAMDALANYFFAARQLLFAAPALVLCAAAGTQSLRARAGQAALLAFLGAAAFRDYRLATLPKDGFGAQARVLAQLPADTCVAVAPPGQATYYLYLRPELRTKICGEPAGEPHVVAVMSPYSTAAERSQLTGMLERSHHRTALLESGSGEILEYEKR